MTLSIYLQMPGTELVGSLPSALQDYVTYGAGVGAAAKAPEASKALIQFLTSANVASAIRAKGMEPANQ
jgi:molybdate transport system substrate-binding protein